MDWTFWVGGIVILALFVVTRVFLHERRWSQRPRPEDEEDTEDTEAVTREEPNHRDGSSEPPTPQDRDTP